MINNNEISNNEIKFFMGYSGWHEDQLENEIKEKSWILDDSSTKVCMQKSNSELFGRNTQNTVVVFPKENYSPGQYVNVEVTDCTSATLKGKAISLS